MAYFLFTSVQWRHNERVVVSNHQPHDCLLNHLFGRGSKKTSKLRVTGLCAGNSPGTGEFPAKMASNAENVSIWWRHHVLFLSLTPLTVGQSHDFPGVQEVVVRDMCKIGRYVTTEKHNKAETACMSLRKYCKHCETSNIRLKEKYSHVSKHAILP